MIYVFDTNVLIVLFRNYYQNRFPSLWRNFNEAVTTDRIISCREALKEIEQQDDSLAAWAKSNPDFFQLPDQVELKFVAQIFAVPHFQSLIRSQERLSGKPVADPFIIAKASVLNGCVVTQETNKPNSSRIPNICEHFGVTCLNLEGFMERENWIF